MQRALVDFRWRRGTPSRWADKNPILEAGEPGLEIGTGKYKIGDGLTRWNDLPYFINEDQVTELIDSRVGSGGGGPDSRIGDLAELTTADKTTVVAAINDVNTPSVPLVDLYNNAKAG